MKRERPSWTEVSMANLQHNCETVRKLVGPDRHVCAVVKANGYGHGAVEVAKACIAGGADYLAVAMMSEALHLRKNGLMEPILILGWTPEYAYDDAVNGDIRLAMFNVEEAKALNEVAKQLGKKAKIHLKLDTGMSRIGFMPNDDSLAQIAEILKMEWIEVEGMFSHFSKADELDKTYAHGQLAKFQAFAKRIEEELGYRIPIQHMANSAAIIDLPEAYMDMVRPGIMLYGFQPSDEMEHVADLKPALVWKAQVGRVQVLPESTLIGYGGTYKTTEPTKVATVPVGYADGYNRLLSNYGYVLCQGKKLPIVGRVCMDQFMVNASEIEDLKAGDEVMLIGVDGDVSLTVTEMAKMLKTIEHEIVCGIAARVPRIYQ